MEIQGTDPQFLAVWDRVQAVEQRKPEDWQELLTQKIRAELARRRRYLALGLTGCADGCFYRANALRTACFFFFGHRHWPSLPQNASEKTPCYTAIRSLFREEVLEEQDYLQLRDACPSELLRVLFAQCAQSCRKSRLALWRSIEQTPEGCEQVQ